MTVTVNVAVLLSVILYLRFRKGLFSQAKSAGQITAALALSLGLLLYPTPTGHWVAGILTGLLSGIGQALSTIKF